MRTTCILLALGLLVATATTGNAQAADCGIEAAVELFPCASVNGTVGKQACCDGLFKNVPQKSGVAIQRWAEAGCFCIDDIYNYNSKYFDDVLNIAATCEGNAGLVAKTKNNCPAAGALPANGFEAYNSASEVKSAVEAMPPKVPPAPPPAPKAAPQKKVELNIVLEKDPSIIGTDAQKKELTDAIAAKLGVKPGQVKITVVSKGSTIITAEVVPEAGASEISATDMDRINAEIANAQKDTTAGAFIPARYGSVKATTPAPGPAGAPAPVRPNGRVVYKTPAPPSNLPPSIIGLPRTNPLNGKEYEGGFVITDSDYAASLAGQGMAGFAMAAILIISMVLMILVYIVSAICGAIFCKCCNQAYKPRKFKKRDLLLNKFVMLGFCVVTAVGCFVIFAETGPLLENTKDLTGGMADTISDLSTTVDKIADTLNAAAQDPTINIGDVAESTDEMKTAARSVDKTVQDAQNDIERVIDTGGGYTFIASCVMFGVSFMIFAAALIGWYRLLILLMVILSIFMILGWVAWGLLSITAVFVDDLCTAMKQYLNDKYSSDLKDFIPCLDPKAAVDVMHDARKMVIKGVTAVNEELEEYAGSNKYLRYLCNKYVKINIEDLCQKETPFFDQDYTKFTCEAKQNNKLNGLKAESGVVYAYPDAYCPFPTTYYSVEIGNFGEPAPMGLRQLRCPFSSKLEDGTSNTFGLAQCYTMRQIPHDVFDEKTATAVLSGKVIDVIPDIETLLRCELVSTAFNRMVGPCDGMAEALAALWSGMVLVAIGYFCIWVSAIVIISRLRFYKEYCEDAAMETNKV